MTETPRTDGMKFTILSDTQSGTREVVDVDIASQLETDLIAAQKELVIWKEQAIGWAGFAGKKAVAAEKAEQALALRGEPVAWLYTMRGEKQILGQQCAVDRFNPDLRPFGRKGIDYDPSYEVEELPLYAAPISGERDE